MSVVVSYRDLVVWQKAMDLVVLVYGLTGVFSKTEMYGLVSQMRRSAVSIPSNIAEGKMRSSRKDYRNFVLNASGSGAELETQLEICRRLKYASEEKIKKIENLLTEIMKMLNVIAHKLNESIT